MDPQNSSLHFKTLFYFYLFLDRVFQKIQEIQFFGGHQKDDFRRPVLKVFKIRLYTNSFPFIERPL